MTELIEWDPGDRVLEIGTGSGYQAAILAELVSRVQSIEIIPPLGEQAAQRLLRLGYENVETRIGDGMLRALRPGGLIAITRWVKLSPRDGL